MMERALKERIIGAIVLVIFVVLVVPIFLDGPPQEDEIVSERVLLPGQEDQNIKTVILDRERTEPMPITSAPASNANTAADSAVEASTSPETVVRQPPPAVETAPAQEEKKPDPRPEPPKTQPATSSSGMWAVQLGSFSSKENADRLAADLRKQGYMAFVSQLQTSSGQWHRVRIGPQENRDSAEEMVAKLLKVGHKGQVLPHP